MAADQRKRRLNASTPFAYSSREHHRAKKAALAVQPHDFNLNSHVSLKWDENEKKVFAKREQVGIPWRHLSQFVSFVPRHNNVLADVFQLPEDIFQLKDLADVISYEGWWSLLNETERKHLKQFLPGVVEPDHLVETLLSGENFHFGNPFSRWGNQICSGVFHPDVIVHHEQMFKANKKAYYNELQNYHDNMIDNLLNLRERCFSSKDPEGEFQQLASRSRKLPMEWKSCDNEENTAAASESSSWVADEKGGNSDNQNPSLAKDGKLQKWIGSKEFIKDDNGKAFMSPDVFKLVSKPKRGDMWQKPQVNQTDGSKYMSYVMISKKQLNIVKSMKQSGSSMQSKALNRVLGNLDSFNVKPYEMFVEEEQKRILDHWSSLASKDIPSAYGYWRKRQIERLEMSSALWLEMEKMDLPVTHDDEDIDDQLQPSEDGPSADPGPSSVNDKEFDSSSGVPQTLSLSPSLDVNKECNPVDLDAEDDNCHADNTDTSAASSEYRQVSSRTTVELPVMSNYHGNHDASDATKVEEVSIINPSARDAWPGISMPDSFCNPSSSSLEYESSHELSLSNPHLVDSHQPVSMIDLESGVPEDHTTTKGLLHRPTDIPFCCTYQNQDRSELLQSLVKRDDYDHEPKKTGLEFHPPANVMIEQSPYPESFREQLPSPFVFQNKGLNDPYMNLQDRLFPNNSQYSIPRQEHIPPLNMSEWSNSRIAAPIHTHHLSSVQLLNNPGWFSGESRSAVHAHGSWSGLDGTSAFANNSLGGSSSGDQSLYSVLSHCSTFRAHNPYDTMGVVSTEKFISTGNFGEDMIGGGIPRVTNPLAQPLPPLDFLSAHDTAPTMKPNGMGWAGLPHQASVPDSTGKRFLKSWDQ